MAEQYEVYRNGRLVANYSTKDEAVKSANRRCYYGDVSVFFGGQLVYSVQWAASVNRKAQNEHP